MPGDEISQNIPSTEKKGFNCLKNIVYMHLFFVYLLPWTHFFSPLKNKKQKPEAVCLYKHLYWIPKY